MKQLVICFFYFKNCKKHLTYSVKHYIIGA
nr:MAG TPA: hypothetical protein [Caudoviricetes sp.]